MSIASEIERLQGCRADILQAIADKGVTVPEGSKFEDCSSLIEQIQQGGGGWERSYAIINGHKYATIKKDGVEWMAQNLREVWSGIVLTDTWDGYGSGGNQAYRFEMASTDYPDGDVRNLLGYIYRQDTRNAITGNVSADGWRIPSLVDFDALVSTESSGLSFISTISKTYSGYTGTDITGFSSISADRNGYNSTAHYISSNNGPKGYMALKSFRSDGVIDNYNSGTSQTWVGCGFCRLVRNYSQS